jgi:polysaccharide biosynthesis protein PslG
MGDRQPFSASLRWRTRASSAMLDRTVVAPRSCPGTVRVLVAVAVCLSAFAAAPARAQARWSFELGIGEQGIAMFSDPRFAALGLEHVRLVVPYDVACRPGSAQRYLDTWLAAAGRAGARPLIAFASGGRSRWGLPSYRTYLRCMRAFHARYPRVRDFNPWNEANHGSQPTYRNPVRAAGFYNALRRVCRRCNVAAGDVLDWWNMRRWVAKYKRHLRGRPRLWSMHNYYDVNTFHRWRNSGTRRLLRLTRGRLWISETAGIVFYSGAGRLGERSAARATRAMLSLPRHSRRITRVYSYQWQAECRPANWDSAWFRADGSARPSYRVVVRALARERHLDAEAVKALDPPLWPGAPNTCAS